MPTGRLAAALGVLAASMLGCAGSQRATSESHEAQMRALCDSPTVSGAVDQTGPARLETIAYWIGSNIREARVIAFVDSLADLRPGDIGDTLTDEATRAGVAQCALTHEATDWVWLPRQRGAGYSEEEIEVSELVATSTWPKDEPEQPVRTGPTCEYDAAFDVRTAKNLMTRCFKRAIRQEGAFEGPAKVSVSFGSMGTVVATEVDAPNEAMKVCLDEAVKKWRLGTPDGCEFEPTTISFTAQLHAD